MPVNGDEEDGEGREEDAGGLRRPDQLAEEALHPQRISILLLSSFQSAVGMLFVLSAFLCHQYM
jgi:hypothetical protein